MVTEHGIQGDGNTSFLRAARAGNLDKVLEHLKNNIEINTSNANGLNALHLASKDGHIHVVTELLRRGAIVDSATKKGNTALHIASLAGQEEVVKILLQHASSVNVQSQNGFTPLYMAAQENHDSVVKLLLSNGANQSLATEDGFTPLAVAMQQGHDKVVAVLLESDTRGKVRLPALHIAAKKDDVKAATLLLDNDHNPDVTSKSGFTPLHIASHYGNQSIANLLIQRGADVNFSAKHNIGPLHVAAKWGKTNMVSLLLEKGSNIEAKTRDGLTPLHCAARSGHEQVVDMLLERGAPISAKTKNGLAPLHMAAQGEHVDAARILLYHRAPVDEVTVDYLTALHVAAHCGHVRVAKLLLDRNADANARALNGFTPLHIACKKNRIKVVELLLRHGASISATTESGLTPLHVAAFMGCMNIVIYLLQHDASPDVPTVRGETPLHLAARANQTDIIRILLRNSAQVDARAREQQTPLHIASRLGNVDIVMLLLQHGAQVDATTKDMYTALHIAAKEGQDEVAALLIENGAAIDAATKKGFTPLHLAAKYGHIKVTQLLLQKEADVDAQGKNGVTPLHVACHYDNQNVALLLLEKGASAHATAKNGHTPLHIAARKNQMDIATSLLEYGAEANAESKAGFTPLHLSSQDGHGEISSLLIEHKAAVNHPAKNGLTPMHLCAQEDNISVAEILQRNGANIDMATKAGYTPIHVAAHFGQANMVRFLLQHGGNVDAATSIAYTPLHQSAQQGHCHIVKLLLEHNANANAHTTSGQTPLDIARKLGYISVLDSLKTITDESKVFTQQNADEKYRVVAPEAMQESFMSDSEEEGGEDNMLSDQPYRYLTVDEMKSLGDDSLPIDVTRDERVDSNRMAQSAEFGAGFGQHHLISEDSISPYKAQTFNAAADKSMVDGIYMANGVNKDEHQHIARKLQWKSFLVSFLVDARGGAMRGCRHSGVRMIIPSRSTCQPTRVTCRYVKPQRTMHPPQLMEGEALASRVLELGPVSTKFIGPVIMEVPHFASLRGKEREIIILRSDNGETWREHAIDNSEDIIHDVLQKCFEPEEIAQLEEQVGNHVCRFVTYDFPQYFAVVTRIRQEVHAIGPEGGMVSSTVVPQVQAVFPQGALTKKIKVGLQAQPVDPDLTAKLLGRGVAVSPIVTVEPRRRKFHKAITLSMPAPKAHSQGMINQYSGNTPTLRLLCSITGGPSRAQWEDVTGSTPLTFVNDCVSFTTTVSARFWLMDCRNISDATKMATELYKEVIHVPFMAKFVVFAKKVEPFEARLRIFCITDDREDKTLEKMELYTQVAKSRDVEVLEGKPQYTEMAGNLVPVTKSGEQLPLPFKAFRENRLPFTVRVKDQHADIVGRTLFMKEPKVSKGEPPQHPICILNIVLPQDIVPDSITAFSDKVNPPYRCSLLSFSKHQNDHYIGDIRIVDLSNLLGRDWTLLASEIEIDPDEIDEIINQNADSIARQAQSMIRLYKDKPNYDIHSLEKALKNIGRDDIMNKCKSGRLSHSRELDDTDIIKNCELVEELVRKKSKRIQQIHEREEVKYSAEEKEIEESESDEEIARRTVAERREKIVKCLSVERQIPASSQKREITREIKEIKRKSLIEDKKAIHESEIFMQLPADNSVKSAVIPQQLIKMKMGKIESPEVSKSDFEKELSYKFIPSSRNFEEKEAEQDDRVRSRLHSQVCREEVENMKIVKDITSVEKPSKIKDSLIGERPSMDSGSQQLTKDFLVFEKLTQLPSQEIAKRIIDPNKCFEDSQESFATEKIKENYEEVISKAMEPAIKRIESTKYLTAAQEKLSFSPPKKFSKEETLKDDQLFDDNKETTVADSMSVKDKKKAFTETRMENVKNNVCNISESFEKEYLRAVEIQNSNVKTEKDFLLSQNENVTETLNSFNESALNHGKPNSSKTDSRVLDVEERSDSKLEDKRKEISISKDPILKKTIYSYEKNNEVLKENFSETHNKTISGTQRVSKELKEYFAEVFECQRISESITFVDPQKIDVKPQISEHESKNQLGKDSTLKKKNEFSAGKKDNNGIIQETKSKSRQSNIEIVKTEKKISEMNKQPIQEASIAKINSEELKDSIITVAKTVDETVQSLSDPKIATSKIEQQFHDLRCEKSETHKLSESVLSLNKLIDTSCSIDPKFEREKPTLATKIGEKIADFEAKNVTYEYHGVEPEESVKLSTKAETLEKELISIKFGIAPEAAARSVQIQYNIQHKTDKVSLEKLGKMTSIIGDAQKITKDFFNMDQQSQSLVQPKVEIRDETKVIDETVKTVITLSSMAEKAENDKMLKKIKKNVDLNPEMKKVSYETVVRETADQLVRETILESGKLTIEQKNQLSQDKQHSDNISTISFEKSQVNIDFEKLSSKPSEVDARKITHDFINMEQQLFIALEHEKEDKLRDDKFIDEGTKIPMDSKTSFADQTLTQQQQHVPMYVTPTDLYEEKKISTNMKTDLVQQDSIEKTKDFLSIEQTSPNYKKLVVKSAGDVIAPTLVDQHKSPPDEKFCKSVQDSITKKMSEGLIEINDDLMIKETLQTYIPEPQQLVSINNIATQETKSTDILLIPTSTVTTPTTSIEADSSNKLPDLPKPKPRSVKTATTCEENNEEQGFERTKSRLPSETDRRDSFLDISDHCDVSVVPVPKPRGQMKTSDSLKDLESLNEHKIQYQQIQQNQHSQSDSVSLRSFDYTEDTSRTDDPSLSLKSQHLDYTSTATTLEDPATQSIDPPTELSIHDNNVEKDRKTNFYIGESSRNIITKTTPTKLSASEGDADEPMTVQRVHIETTDISLIKEFSEDSDEENNVFKKYVKIKPSDAEADNRIRRQSSETRNDLLEEDTATKETTNSSVISVGAATSAGVLGKKHTVRESGKEQNLIASASTINSALIEAIHSIGEGQSVQESFESIDIERERPTGLSLDKSKSESSEKDIPPPGKGKIVHSPEAPPNSSLKKEVLTKEIVKKTLEEVQESLDVAKDELKSILKDAKSVKESPSEFEFRPFSHPIIDTKAASDGEKLSKTDYRIQKEETYLHNISTGSAVSQGLQTSPKDILKEQTTFLNFGSSKTEEDLSSMKEYREKKLDNANVVCEAKKKSETSTALAAKNPGSFGDISYELTIKPFEDVLHCTKSDSTSGAQSRWSVPEFDQSSSSESFYKSSEISESLPLSSDIEIVMTQANSSEYQTAADVLYSYKETTEFVSALSTLDHSSGKTISSRESMRSLDSQSEVSANLGSIDLSELSQTLVASSTEEPEDIKCLRDLAGEEDSDDSLDFEATDDAMSEYKIQQQSQMKRSQEMIFKAKADEIQGIIEVEEQENTTLNMKNDKSPKKKEIEKSWGLTYPMEESTIDDLKDAEDLILYHADIRHSLDESKCASSLEEGTIFSVSPSSTSNLVTVAENLELIVGSVGASSLAGIEGFSSSPFQEEATFVMEMEEANLHLSFQDLSPIAPSMSGDDLIVIPDRDRLVIQCEGKESESESDTDPYETEYARQFRSPSDRKSKKKKEAAAEMDYGSHLVTDVIVEDSLTEELEADNSLLEKRRSSPNMPLYAATPNITVSVDAQKQFSILKENAFEEKALFKVKTEEQFHKATADSSLHEEKEMNINLQEKNFQRLVEEQYKQKLAELKKSEIRDSDYDYNKAPDSPDSFEMVDQPDISEEFVIVEEVAKEANEVDMGGKRISIAATKYESQHDEEVEKIIIKSAPADPKLGSQILRDDLNFYFEESPPTASSGGTGSEPKDESDSGSDLATNNKRWVETQLTDNQLRYPYDLPGCVLEDIKEEDAEFEIGSGRISSFKDSFSSTPENDVMGARRYYAARGEHDNMSISSLQEFESLEQAISLENRNRTQQGSTDSSNGSFQRRYIMRNNLGATAPQGDDITISSLTEFEGLENACIEAHLIEIKAREEAALLCRSDESKKSNESDSEDYVDPSKVTGAVKYTEIQLENDPPNIKAVLKQKLQNCESDQSSARISQIAGKKRDLHRGSMDTLELNLSLNMGNRSVNDSFETSKDGKTKSDIDSPVVNKRQVMREESIEPIALHYMDNVMSKFDKTLENDITNTVQTSITSTDVDGHTTRIIEKLSETDAISKSFDITAHAVMSTDYPSRSLNQISNIEQTTTTSEGGTDETLREGIHFNEQGAFSKRDHPALHE